MKKGLFGILIVVLLASPVMGQQVYLGVTGGINRADMDMVGDGVEQTVNPRNFWGAGAVIGVRLGKHFSVQLRPFYLQKGGTLDQNPPKPVVDFTMSFIELDLSIKAAAGKHVRPYIVAGPSLGIVMTSEAEFEESGFRLLADVKGISKTIEYSLTAGGGIEFSLWKGFIFVEGRYHFGINNLNKGGTIEFKLDGVTVDTAVINTEDSHQNRGFQITAGYLFCLGNE